jgi:hypothetical protein
LGTDVYQEVDVSSRLRSIFRLSSPPSVVLVLHTFSYTLLCGTWKDLEDGKISKNPGMARRINKIITAECGTICLSHHSEN